MKLIDCVQKAIDLSIKDQGKIGDLASVLKGLILKNPESEYSNLDFAEGYRLKEVDEIPKRVYQLLYNLNPFPTAAEIAKLRKKFGLGEVDDKEFIRILREARVVGPFEKEETPEIKMDRTEGVVVVENPEDGIVVYSTGGAISPNSFRKEPNTVIDTTDFYLYNNVGEWRLEQKESEQDPRQGELTLS